MGRPGEDKMTDIFKQKLENYNPEYNPDAWKALSSRLNYARGPKFSYKTLSMGFTAGILFMLSIYYFLPNNKSANTEITQLEKQLNELENKVAKIESISSDRTFQSLKSNTPKNSLYGQNDFKSENRFTSFANHHYVFIESNSTKNTRPELINKNKLKPLNGIYSYNTYDYVLTKDSLHFNESNVNNNLSKNKKKQKSKLKINWPSFKLNNNRNNHNKYSNFTGPNEIFGIANIFDEHLDNGQNFNSKGFGIGVSGPISSNISISCGLVFSTASWNTKTFFEKTQNIIISDTSSTTVVVDSIITNTNQWQYLQIPISLNYNLLNTKKSALDLTFGISSRLYFTEKYYKSISVPNEPNVFLVDKYDSFENKHWLSNSQIGIKYNYKLSRHWNIKAEPYYSIPISATSALKTKSKGWGFNFNVSYKFNPKKE